MHALDQLTDGAYRGWNAPAVIATLAGCAAAWGGLVVPALKPLYDYAWFVGFGVGFLVYAGLMQRGASTAPLPTAEG